MWELCLSLGNKALIKQTQTKQLPILLPESCAPQAFTSEFGSFSFLSSAVSLMAKLVVAVTMDSALVLKMYLINNGLEPLFNNYQCTAISVAQISRCFKHN